MEENRPLQLSFKPIPVSPKSPIQPFSLTRYTGPFNKRYLELPLQCSPQASISTGNMSTKSVRISQDKLSPKSQRMSFGSPTRALSSYISQTPGSVRSPVASPSEKQLSHAYAKLQNFETQHNELSQTFKSQIHDLRRQIDKENAWHMEDLKNIQNDQKSYSTNVLKHKQDNIDDLNEKIKTIKGNIREASSKWEWFQTELDDMRQTYYKDTQWLETDVQDIKLKIKELHHDYFDIAKPKITSLEEVNLSNASSHDRRLNFLNIDYKAKKDELQKTFENKDLEIANLEYELDQLRHRQTMIKEENRENIGFLKSNLKRSRHNSDVQISDLQRLSAEYEALWQQYETMKHENHILENSLQNLEDKNELCREEVQKLEKRVFGKRVPRCN